LLYLEGLRLRRALTDWTLTGPINPGTGWILEVNAVGAPRCIINLSDEIEGPDTAMRASFVDNASYHKEGIAKEWFAKARRKAVLHSVASITSRDEV
jgi:hypothetical protein